MQRRVIVSGVAGSGKDHLLRYAQPQLAAYGFRQINFGEAMQARASDGTAGDRNLLRYAPTQTVRQLAACVMGEVIALDTDIVLNTHLVVKQDDAYVCGVANIDIFKPTAIVHVWAAPDLIAQRRASDHTRNRAAEAAGLITLHQELERTASEVIALNLHAQFTSVANNHIDTLEAVETLCKGACHE